MKGANPVADSTGAIEQRERVQTFFTKEEFEGANPIADSTGAFGTGLVMQHSSAKELGSRRDRECDDGWQQHSIFNKELRSRMQNHQTRP